MHRQTFPLPNADEPLEELCVDGGKVLGARPPKLACQWRDYKAIATDSGIIANFQNNAQLIEWVNAQPLSNPITCLGDGHDGVWNIVQQLALGNQRQEILNWYHLKENLSPGGRVNQAPQAGGSLAVERSGG